MFTINVEKECGCFKRSAFENNKSFESKDDALMQAKLMENHMNQKFCQKHLFTAVEDGDNIKIKVEMKPQATSGGCCGGGHCS
ncbi:hypothetical protein [Sulfurovum mangrovi]|uniref:hypothetical protein n=1 Tax=Sulfurovum mangrovi TaxID=2893889 RepID=UPI001E3AF1C8|nr:hypothetical protein [Sulfurovum mangrovi]UFH59515.1 hypothetical protein LN246_01380 [Sulfurovum mangrovi]UFH60665.1 hypothetical protein LN246_13925 [Sulfurovum mangrovi]